MKLKKMERCGYEIGQLENSFNKDQRQWTDKDFPYVDI